MPYRLNAALKMRRQTVSQALAQFLMTSVVALSATGCATMAPLSGERHPLVSAEQQLIAAQTGRFSLRIEGESSPNQGLQGRFEWMELASVGSSPIKRQLLIWIGPLGQSLGRIERETSLLDDRISIYGDQGQPLSIEQQFLFIEKAVGPAITPSDVAPFAISLMEFFKSTLQSPPAGPVAETGFRFNSRVIRLRVVPDA